MRHRVSIKKFNRDTKSRKALVRNLVRSLVEHGYVVTSEARAKEIKRVSDKLFFRAKEDSLANRRQLHSFFGKRDVVNVIFERIMPLYVDRVSGFTRIEKVGIRRGDNTEVVKLSLVNQPERTGTLAAERSAPISSVEKSDVEKPVAKKTPAKRSATKQTAAKRVRSTEKTE